jgi:xanthine dehydrogenase YagS FAD-binding subunit
VNFDYVGTHTLEDAAARLSESGAAPLGGGTDLLTLVDEGLLRPSTLVDLRGVAGSREITEASDGSLRIGASARIHDVATDARIRSRYPALAEACEVVGTPALRRMGTIGGNLCQRPRCWYYRRGIPCHKNGGHNCPAEQDGGESQYLAILDGGPCYIVHPSDPAVAFAALDATIEVTRAGRGTSAGVATRSVPIEEFFVLPSERLDRETALEPGEFVSAVTLPAASARGKHGAQRYYKAMQRESWDFALVSLAAVRRDDGDVRLVLGGVAPRPWRVNPSVEEDVAAGELDDDGAASLAERALLDARPLAKNAYKVEVASALIRRAVRELSA